MKRCAECGRNRVLEFEVVAGGDVFRVCGPCFGTLGGYSARTGELRDQERAKDVAAVRELRDVLASILKVP